MKLKVAKITTRRATPFMVREAVGDDVRIMLDANQATALPQAIDACLALKGMNPFWMEEPTQPDDVSAHKTLDKIAPVPVAVGERFPTVRGRIFAGRGGRIMQADCTRLAGISEWLAVVMLARKFPSASCRTWATWGRFTSTSFCSATSRWATRNCFLSIFRTCATILFTRQRRQRPLHAAAGAGLQYRPPPT